MPQPKPNPQPTRSPGQIALSVMGWLELTVSVILFVLEVHVAAAVFGLAALFVTLVATQVQRQMIAYRERTGQPTAVSPPREAGSGAIGFWALLGVGAALLVASGVFAALKNYAFAGNFVLWALTLGLFAQRVAQSRGRVRQDDAL